MQSLSLRIGSSLHWIEVYIVTQVYIGSNGLKRDHAFSESEMKSETRMRNNIVLAKWEIDKDRETNFFLKF